MKEINSTELFNKKSATQILKECNQYHCIPVNIKKILDNYKVVYLENDFSTISKLENIAEKIKEDENINNIIFNKDGVINIIYNKRMINSLAYGFSFCCLYSETLEKQGVLISSNPNSVHMNKKDEKINDFLGELLIPESSLQYVLDKLYIPSLNGLVQIFKVLPHIMKQRLKKLNIDYIDDIGLFPL